MKHIKLLLWHSASGPSRVPPGFSPPAMRPCPGYSRRPSLTLTMAVKSHGSGREMDHPISKEMGRFIQAARQSVLTMNPG